MDKFFSFGEGPELVREGISRDMPIEIVEKINGSADVAALGTVPPAGHFAGEWI